MSYTILNDFREPLRLETHNWVVVGSWN